MPTSRLDRHRPPRASTTKPQSRRRARLVVDLRGVTRSFPRRAGVVQPVSSGIGSRSGARRAPRLLLQASRVQVEPDVALRRLRRRAQKQDARSATRCAIDDHAILGKLPRLARHSLAHGEVGPLELGSDVSVGAGAVVFAGARIADGAILGDQTFVRERASDRRSARSSAAAASSTSDVRARRARAVQTNVYLTAFTLVEDDVFIGSRACTTTNDDTMSLPRSREHNRSARQPCGAPAGSVAARC